jgi:hypothetical protein
MSARIWPALVFFLALPLARSDEGAASPKELMTAVTTALEANDLAQVKRLIDAKTSTAEILELYASLLSVDHGFEAQRKAAIAKFGKDIADAVDTAGTYLAKMHVDFGKLASAGKVEKQEGGDTRIVYTLPEGEEGQSYSVAVLERDGRWYLSAEPPEDADDAKVMLDLVRAMVPASQKLIAAIKAALAVEGKDVAQFRAALQTAGEAFNAALEPASEPSGVDKPPDGSGSGSGSSPAGSGSSKDEPPKK